MTLIDARKDASAAVAKNQLHHFSVIVNDRLPETLVATAFPILHCVRPKWDITDIDHEFFSGGLTNKIVCFWNRFERNKDDRILFRFYDSSSEVIIDRRREYACMLLLHDYCLSAPLYCSFANGNVYGFVPGDVLSDDLVQDEKIASLIAKQMACLHSVEMPNQSAYDVLNDRRPVMFREVEKFIAAINPHFEDEDLQTRYENEFISITDMYKELNYLEEHFKKLNSPIVFCHNDLLLKNIIYDAKKEKIAFIDFEYAGFNFQSFDIADHFAEFAGTENVDFTKYPDEKYRKFWINEYLTEYRKLNNIPAHTKSDVDKLDKQVQASVLGTHLFWSIWCIVQAQNSHIDYDYIGYGIIRLKEYFRLKELC